MSDLQQELRVYEQILPKLLAAHEGDFVVIRGERTVHFSSSYEAALEWAYEHFGLDRFFVKKVASASENVVHFTRDLGPCRP